MQVLPMQLPRKHLKPGQHESAVPLQVSLVVPHMSLQMVIVEPVLVQYGAAAQHCPLLKPAEQVVASQPPTGPQWLSRLSPTTSMHLPPGRGRSLALSHSRKRRFEPEAVTRPELAVRSARV